MKYTIYKKCDFESAHQLDGHSKCGKLHGHSYVVEFWVSSEKLNSKHGFVVDFGELSKVIDEYDHSDKVITVSCEQLAETLSKLVQSFLQGDKTQINVRVRVWETKDSWAEVVS